MEERISNLLRQKDYNSINNLVGKTSNKTELSKFKKLLSEIPECSDSADTIPECSKAFDLKVYEKYPLLMSKSVKTSLIDLFLFSSDDKYRKQVIRIFEDVDDELNALAALFKFVETMPDGANMEDYSNKYLNRMLEFPDDPIFDSFPILSNIIEYWTCIECDYVPPHYRMRIYNAIATNCLNDNFVNDWKAAFNTLGDTGEVFKQDYDNNIEKLRKINEEYADRLDTIVKEHKIDKPEYSDDDVSIMVDRNTSTLEELSIKFDTYIDKINVLTKEVQELRERVSILEDESD